MESKNAKVFHEKLRKQRRNAYDDKLSEEQDKIELGDSKHYREQDGII